MNHQVGLSWNGATQKNGWFRREHISKMDDNGWFRGTPISGKLRMLHGAGIFTYTSLGYVWGKCIGKYSSTMEHLGDIDEDLAKIWDQIHPQWRPNQENWSVNVDHAILMGRNEQKERYLIRYVPWDLSVSASNTTNTWEYGGFLK